MKSAGRAIFIGLVALAACGRKSDVERYPEAAAGIVADIAPAAQGYFGQPSQLTAIGRTIDGSPCAWAVVNGERYFLHANDMNVVALRASSPALAGWGELCILDDKTPIRAPRPIRTAPTADGPRAHDDPVQPSESQTWVAAQASVRGQLRAPDTARFVELKNRRGQACGLVDAENGAGGRTGPMRFVFSGSFALLEEGAAPEAFADAWNRYCSG